MDVGDAILARRAKRAIGSKPVEPEKVAALVQAMRLSASCNNNQPWRVTVCRGQEAISKARTALTKGNVWATRAPLIMVVAAKLDQDCHGLADGRDYYLFGCGLAVGQMLLRATELGLVAHPIAGYNPLTLKQELGIPADHVVIAMVIVGYLDGDMSLLSDKQRQLEPDRPERKPVSENFFEGAWAAPLQG